MIEELEKRLKAKHNNNVAKDRKKQVGSGERGDKIRTYRFQDDQCSDHVTGKTVSCFQVMKGRFDLLWN
jgi:peptide chain release factor 1